MSDETKAVLEEIAERLEKIEHNQQIILACTLLPKDGFNWSYYESLFRHAERRIRIDKGGLGLDEMVEEVLVPRPGDRSLLSRERKRFYEPETDNQIKD